MSADTAGAEATTKAAPKPKINALTTPFTAQLPLKDG
jgi:hypothetical protein